jgi:GNAT superfamily N-acetyltransferase
VSGQIDICALDAPLEDGTIDQLASVLTDCVNGGASVSFMAPFSHDDAVKFFRKIAASIAAGDTVLLAAKLDGRIVGTVQLGLDTPPNQPHRADVKKMLVERAARGRGIGAALMAAVEKEARRRRRWLLVLDTVPGESGYRLYKRAGFTESGIIPNYALFPDGRLCDTAMFWKRLEHDPEKCAAAFRKDHARSKS